MAHVVGVPRRDPCQKCQLPVFLAERLTVGKKVFHRTCLKCARCGSQLAIGSFYETEDDDVFCCETCPDEEELDDEVLDNVELRGEQGNSGNCEIQPTPKIAVRSSIADRLAFFEQSKTNGDTSKQQHTRNVLQKSVSDEEKSKDLQANVPTSTYRMNTALSSFLNDTIDGAEDNDNEESSSEASTSVQLKGAINDMDTSDAENESESAKEPPPSLPTTKPPTLTEEVEVELQKRFTATAELQLAFEEPSSTAAPKNENVEIPDLKIEAEPLKIPEEAAESTANDLDLSATYKLNNESVTKDINAGEALETTTQDLKHVVEMRENVNGNEDKATTERLSVVRARLQQFEEISNNKTNNNLNDNDENETTRTSPAKDNLIISNENEDKFEANENQATEKVEDNDKRDDNNGEMLATATENIENEVPKSMPIEIVENEKVAATTKATATATPTPKASPRRVHTPQKQEKQENELAAAEIATSTTTPSSSPAKSPTKNKLDDYPEDLNPFASDDDDNVEAEPSNKENKLNSSNSQQHSPIKSSTKVDNSNPFDSSDDEIELEKMNATPILRSNASGATKVRPPRPPPPRISRNPFDGDSDNEADSFSRNSSLSSSAKRKTPVPTPRSNLSQNATPEPTPRLSNRSAKSSPQPPNSLALNNSSEHYGSYNSLGASTPLHRNSDIRGSSNSLTSSASSTVRSRKNRKAPAPPQPPTVRELFPSTETLGSSMASTPSSSTVGSPKLSRKKRPAPAPPKPARNAVLPQIMSDHESKNLHSYPLQSLTVLSKLSDEEKALLEGNTAANDHQQQHHQPAKSPTQTPVDKLIAVTRRNSRRLIPLDPTLLKDAAENSHEHPQCDDQKQELLSGKPLMEEEHNVFYRRVIMPPSFNTPTHDSDRQSEKLKDNKEAKNRNRQSQQSASSGAEDNDAAIYNKSAHGKWKRRKGPAPALPIPPRKVLQMLPLQEIKHELEIIEVQQQGLEKQGVVLEKMIRDRCEGQAGEQLNSVTATVLAGGAGDQSRKPTAPEGVQNSKEVEDLILQLFELVNEKNELFRRQAELMYLRRQHRLEQEQADLEYEIRVLMAQPERNKTDTDKAREEALIARLVDVVQLRNEVVECLEMDRLREAEEDMSIKLRLEQHNAKRDGHNSDDSSKKRSSKLSKKEKKKQKEAEKLSRNKKIDADKDADETEINANKQKLRKKKRKFLF